VLLSPLALLLPLRVFCASCVVRCCLCSREASCTQSCRSSTLWASLYSALTRASLPLPSSSPSNASAYKCATLGKALQRFTAPEQLTKDNSYKCDKCKHMVKAIKRLTVWTLCPPFFLHTTLCRVPSAALSQTRSLLAHSPFSCVSFVLASPYIAS
jgi:hypothetical protein